MKNILSYFYLIVLKILKFKYDINSNFFRSIAYFFKKTVQESPAFGLKEKNPNLFFKQLDLPYVYYIDWLARWNHKVIFNEKKNIFPKTLKLEKNKKIFALHIRFNTTHWKKIKGNLKDKEYFEYIMTLAKDILKDKNNILWIYGSESQDYDIFKKLKILGAIDIQSLSKDAFNLSLILSNANVFIGGVNGYTTYCSFLSWSKNNLENVFIINDVMDPLSKEFWIYDRYYSDLILDKQPFINSYFYNKQRFFKRDNFKYKKNHIKDYINKNFEKIKKSKEIYLHYLDSESESYFGIDIDNFLIDKISKYLKLLMPNIKIIHIRENQDLKKFKSERIYYGQHLLMHYRLRSKNNNKKYNLPNSFEFIKNKLNPSNIIFIDLIQIIMLINNQKTKNSLKNKSMNSFLKTDKVLVEFTEKEANKIALYSSKFFIFIEIFWILLRTRGIKYTINRIKNKIQNLKLNKKSKNKIQKIYINKIKNNISTSNRHNLDVKDYLKLIKNRHIITKNPRIKILNDFLNISKTSIHFKNKKDLLLFNDLKMISSNYEKLSIEDINMNIPIKT